MNWTKRGVLYSSPFDGSWRDNSALTPTLLDMGSNVLRIYVGMRDSLGVSRIGYIDVSKNNPSEVLKISENPVLDVGEKGCFDDNGVILGDVLRVGEEIWMYYVGFQKVKNVKFLAFN